MPRLSPSDVFDQYLDPDQARPIAVAYSGGGDSLMVLRAAKRWADGCGRKVVALNVDHGLQAASGDWTRHARASAERLGVGYQALTWTGAKPAHGLAAAARIARHRLIALAARAIGARVVVFGHTADDVIEGELMRAEGARLGRLRVWSPSPVWPEGRGLMLLRPLLCSRRAAIREALTAEGETWIEDPANLDPRSPRARVRPQAGESPDPAAAAADEGLAELARHAVVGDAGHIRIARRALAEAPSASRLRFLAAALACAGGRAGPPRAERLEAMMDRLMGHETFAATLSGCKLLVDHDLRVVRDAGEIRRGGLAPLRLAPGETGVWDGRFEIVADEAALVVRALAGRTKALCSKERALLKGLPAPARPALPVFDLDAGQAVCPILAETRRGAFRPLVAERLAGACGVILKEPAT